MNVYGAEGVGYTVLTVGYRIGIGVYSNFGGVLCLIHIGTCMTYMHAIIVIVMYRLHVNLYVREIYVDRIEGGTNLKDR
jgi:hypothetical protein